jgi:hypothetical protein
VWLSQKEVEKLIPFFFILCIAFSGGTDCSYDVQIIDDRPLFEHLYDTHKIRNIDASTIQGFPTDDTIYVYNSTIMEKVLVHEIDHARCNIEHQNYDDLRDCHMAIEIRDYEKLQKRDDICNWCHTDHWIQEYHRTADPDFWRYL